jgi:hypothetical protein
MNDRIKKADRDSPLYKLPLVENLSDEIAGAFEFVCADGQERPGSRRDSRVHKINNWLWNFGRPQPRVGGLLVSNTEIICRT